MKSPKKYLLIIFILFINNIVFSNVINVPEDQPTIQAGIDVASGGDTVLVQPSTYVENINYTGKNIIVGSLFLTTQDTTYISLTVIDGNQSGRAATFENSEDSTSVLSGFTITNGDGGICCYNNSSPSLRNLMITGNSTGRGGGIYCHGNSSPNLKNVTMSDNLASKQGGGICCFVKSCPSLSNTVITGNSASGRGGGIYCWDSSPSFVWVTIKGNSSTGRDGGGIYCNSHSNANLKNVVISENSADFGGGIGCEFSSPSLIEVTITDNSARQYGGGIYCFGSHPSFENVIISDNKLDGAFSCLGGGIYCQSSSLSLKNVLISNNTVNGREYSYGGGISAISNSNLSIVNITISNNTAYGGSYSNGGGGIYCNYNCHPNFVNSILWNNSPQEIYFDQSLEPNSLLVAFSDVKGGEEGVVINDSGTVHWPEGNINADPLFADPENGDFHLTESSPCIEAGTAFFEWQGNILVDLSEDEYFGSAPDMGAYEDSSGDGIKEDFVFLPNNLVLYQNYPNPFNAETMIKYQLQKDANVTLRIYNIIGQEIIILVNEKKESGSYQVRWHGKNGLEESMASGIYIYQISTNDFVKTRKMLLLR